MYEYETTQLRKKKQRKAIRSPPNHNIQLWWLLKGQKGIVYCFISLCTSRFHLLIWTEFDIFTSNQSSPLTKPFLISNISPATSRLHLIELSPHTYTKLHRSTPHIFQLTFWTLIYSRENNIALEIVIHIILCCALLVCHYFCYQPTRFTPTS